MTPASLFSLAGRCALVTGSSRGIGRALALALAGSGARVALHGATASVALTKAADEAGGIALTADLGAPSDVMALAEAAQAALGQVDILVLNASIEFREPYDGIDDASFARQVAVNLDATRLLLAALVPPMVTRGWGRVLAIGSVQEAKEHPRMLVYAALKAAQTSMMRNLARQVAARGVTCNTLAPGVVETGRNEAALADDTYRETVRARIPAGHFGTAEDCAGAALLLCSDAGRYITGERLFVDGGLHL